jgi:hypothetical protein
VNSHLFTELNNGVVVSILVGVAASATVPAKLAGATMTYSIYE